MLQHEVEPMEGRMVILCYTMCWVTKEPFPKQYTPICAYGGKVLCKRSRMYCDGYMELSQIH